MAEKKPTGRPSLYDPSYCQRLIKHMEGGLSFESFAGVVLVTRSTIYEWVDQFPEFSDAKKVGTEASRLFWERVGVFYMVNGQTQRNDKGEIVKTKDESLNAAVWVFNMKNRFGWRDKQPDEDKTDITVNLHGAIMKELRAKNASKKTKG